METLVIENEAMRVGVVPDYGARVVGLLDKSSAATGSCPARPAPIPAKVPSTAPPRRLAGDECFPTIAPWQADATVWGRRLRDHGDLWGRPWAVTDHTAAALTTEYSASTFRFTRRLDLVTSVLTAAYDVENLSQREMPYLWALHGLLAASPADRVLIEGIDSVAATYLVDHDHTLASGTVSWPDPGRLVPFRLDHVQPADRHFAGKFYAQVPRRRATIGHHGAFLSLAWEPGLRSASGSTMAAGRPPVARIISRSSRPAHPPTISVRRSRRLFHRVAGADGA